MGLVRRPAGHFLDLQQIQHLSATAWDLGGEDRRQYGNALRANVQIATGLRIAELHALRREDVRPNGTLHVRSGKGSKPRSTVFLDGADQSPTLDLLLRYMDGEGRCRARPVRGTEPIWTSKAPAYSHWVAKRLGPASGLQRRIEMLDPAADSTATRYLIRTHLFRACFVIMARRLPRLHGRPPISWPTIAHWLGHDSEDTTRRHYWFADEDELLAELRDALPPAAPPEIAIRFNPKRRGA